VSAAPVDTLVTAPTNDTSDNKGLAGFTSLPPGKYDLTATKSVTTTAADGTTETTTQTGTLRVTVTTSTTAPAVVIQIEDVVP
jgi:hypothetical protein